MIVVDTDNFYSKIFRRLETEGPEWSILIFRHRRLKQKGKLLVRTPTKDQGKTDG